MCKTLLDINNDGENEIMNPLKSICSFHIITMQSGAIHTDCFFFLCSLRAYRLFSNVSKTKIARK